MSVIHEIFPLVVYQGEVDCHDEFKDKYLNELKDYWFDGYKNESPEYSGRIFVHNKYKLLFNSLKNNIDEYFNFLNVDHSHLSYHVAKSWVGCHYKDTPELNSHNHNESNLGFVYYLNSDSTSDKFCAVQRENPNELIGGLFQTGQKNLLKGFNKYNCNFYTLTPTEGTVLIFPSSMYHKTLKVTERVADRIVIAGDIRITLNPQSPDYHQGTTHPSQWLEL